MFCSTSVWTHLMRGLVAALLLAAGLADELPLLLRLAAAVGAFVLMRGCPMCWLVGLFETAARRRGAILSTPKSAD